jgi:hypothetical protein
MKFELSKAVECAPPRSDSDKVGISFDWEIPRKPSDIVFQVRVERGSRHSAIDFAIDLRRMRGAELEKLHDILVKRHAGLDDGYELTRAITWLLTISLQQQQPSWSDEQREIQVRQLLLADR